MNLFNWSRKRTAPVPAINPVHAIVSELQIEVVKAEYFGNNHIPTSVVRAILAKHIEATL